MLPIITSPLGYFQLSAFFPVLEVCTGSSIIQLRKLAAKTLVIHKVAECQKKPEQALEDMWESAKQYIDHSNMKVMRHNKFHGCSLKVSGDIKCFHMIIVDDFPVYSFFITIKFL